MYTTTATITITIKSESSPLCYPDLLLEIAKMLSAVTDGIYTDDHADLSGMIDLETGLDVETVIAFPMKNDVEIGAEKQLREVAALQPELVTTAVSVTPTPSDA